MLVYLIVLLTVVAGMMQMPLWAALAGACVLTLAMIAERRGLTATPTGLDDENAEPIATLATLLNGSAAASAAFVLGRVTAWLWGI